MAQSGSRPTGARRWIALRALEFQMAHKKVVVLYFGSRLRLLELRILRLQCWQTFKAFLYGYEVHPKFRIGSGIAGQFFNYAKVFQWCHKLCMCLRPNAKAQKL